MKVATMERSKSKPRSVLFLYLGHIVNDTSSNTLSGLLPVLTSLFGLSYLLAGIVVLVSNVTSSILQPFFGYVFDRTKATWLIEIGLAANCIGMSLMGILPNYATLLLIVGIAGLGGAAFHPPAFSIIVKSSNTGRGRSIGIFTSTGNVGFFLGPVAVGVLVSTLGPQGMLFLLPIGLATAALLFKVKPTKEQDTPLTRGKGVPADKRLLVLLMSITALRSITIQSATTFLPLYLVTEGNSLLAATSIASFWLAIGVLGQIAGGFLSDRVGRRPVIVISLLTGGIVFYGFLATTGFFSMLLLAISGALLYASWSVIMAMSSEAAPSNIGTVTGLMLGFSIGVGGVAAMGFGAVADMIGLVSTFNIMSVFALAGGMMALLLPTSRTPQRQVTS